MRGFPMPMTPVVNGIRHKKRLKATLTANHLCGLSIPEGKEIVAELLEPSADPFLPQIDHLFPIPDPSGPEQPEEPILSIYSNGMEGRIRVPMSNIKGLRLISENELDALVTEDSFSSESPLSRIFAYRRAHKLGTKSGYLVLLCEDSDVAHGYIVFACPRYLRNAEKIVDYYNTTTCPGAEALTWSELKTAD